MNWCSGQRSVNKIKPFLKCDLTSTMFTNLKFFRICEHRMAVSVFFKDRRCLSSFLGTGEFLFFLFFSLKRGYGLIGKLLILWLAHILRAATYNWITFKKKHILKELRNPSLFEGVLFYTNERKISILKTKSPPTKKLRRTVSQRKYCHSTPQWKNYLLATRKYSIK